MAGELDLTQMSSEDLRIIAGNGATTAAFSGTAEDSAFESHNVENDNVIFVTTTGNASATFNGGNNSVSANALTTGTLTVSGGMDSDPVEIDNITAGDILVNLDAER